MEDSAMERINRIKSDMRKKETFLNKSGNDSTPFCGPKQEKNVSKYTSRSGDPNRSK
jgi:hypothetical protein